MSGYKDYKGQSVGLARIMAGTPYSDGDTALMIKNFFLDQRGYLDSSFRLMDFIPEIWNGNQPPEPFQSTSVLKKNRSGVYAMGLLVREGSYKDIIFLTKNGVMRYFPWNRPVQAINTSSNLPTGKYGLSEQMYYDSSNTLKSIKLLSR